ncbi:DUF2628 domain-containing protein [Candidatus Thioglobus sp.]|jgi:hypothetical protein|uniref:DUF2628 domain-containing protein n=1 Tax=Candidatus Pseudothioglobus sp. Uisw_086 TaxID=3230998 RepID=UPI00236DE00D|nr:DUF2628 domain-containing protein [Candidatus Thioglobus sp.]
MNSYQVYKHKTKEIKAVKSGFAWLAIPLNLVWFISRGLWKVFFSYILIILFLAGVDYEIYGELGFLNFSTASDLHWLWLLIQIIILTLPGFKGNEWTAKNLRENGYEFAYSVRANNKTTAIKLPENY